MSSILCIILIASILSSNGAVQSRILPIKFGKGSSRGNDDNFEKIMVELAKEGKGELKYGLIENIGCSFQKSLCDPTLEYCFNDNAFGKCLPRNVLPNEPYQYRFSLSKSEIDVLEKEMERLFTRGYRWKDPFTQCVLQNVLLSIRYRMELTIKGLGECVELDVIPDINDLSSSLDKIDSSDLAFIKYSPDEVVVQSPEFIQESYRPDLLTESIQPGEPIELDEEQLEDLLSDYLMQDFPSPHIKQGWKSPSVKKFKSDSIPVFIKDIPKDEGGWSETPALIEATSGGRVNENILKPRIFNTKYNTPDTFRHGLEVKDELEFLNDAPAQPGTQSEKWLEENVLLPNAIPVEIVQPNKKSFNDVNNENMFDITDTDLGNYLINQQLNSELREEQAAQEIENILENRSRKPRFNLQKEDNDGGDDDALELTNQNNNDPIFTEGGLVFLNKNPKRYLYEPSDSVDINDYEDTFKDLISSDYRNPSFERRERLDVKKPGPWYRTVNNYAFDKKDTNQEMLQTPPLNPEFAGIGPADMGSFKEEPVKVANANNNNPDSKDINEMMTMLKKAATTREVSKLAKSLPEFEHLDIIDTSFVNLYLTKNIPNWNTARELLNDLADLMDLKHSIFQEVRQQDNVISFKVGPNSKRINATVVGKKIEQLIPQIQKETDIHIDKVEIGSKANCLTHNSPLPPKIVQTRKAEGTSNHKRDKSLIYSNSTALISTDTPISHPLIAEEVVEVKNKNLYLITFAICGIVAAAIVAAFFIFLIRKTAKSKEKFAKLGQDDPNVESCKDYQDLCRARMAAKTNEKPETIRAVQRVQSGSKDSEGTSSSRSSTSSWSEEPVLTNMDISTGHMVLSYMEDHLKNKDKLDQEWASLCQYEADPGSTAVAEKTENVKKNRYSNSLPYDHSRVILNDLANISGSDYINASTITDHDPRNPAYIATQGPLQNTETDFWQMVWEQGSVVIVTLTKLAEGGRSLCHRYWPEEGSELHHIYEVHLVSEHIWCDEYLVRSFYLKNLKTGETRTVTQFHFLAWPENGIPASTKALLEFRRKVNKSYRGRSCPIIVHCSDGAGRTGTYCLIDMVLNRMAKGAKEIDIAASLEHIRDQRPGMVKTKQQFEFVLMAVAEEVHAILKALPQ